MFNTDTLEKNKNQILNAGIILLALFLSLGIYNSYNRRIKQLSWQQAEGIKKNKLLGDVSLLENRIEKYKKVFVKQDISLVMNTLTELAGSSGVKIVSIKPPEEQKFKDYVKTSFLVALSAPGYHALGEFISKIESYKILYVVDDIDIKALNPYQASGPGVEDLGINLKLSTISYL